MKQNEPLSSLIHFIGFLFAVAGLSLLVMLAVLYGNAWHVTGFSIFGTSMVLLYLASTLYHWLPITHRAKQIMQKIDHAMIFILIAGTYTPITFMFPQRGWGWGLFGVIWGLAVIGVIFKAGGFHMNKWFVSIPYIIMGWLIVIAFIPLTQFLPIAGIWWLIGGGIFYTIGTIFLGLDYILMRARWFGMHEIFHLFVLSGSFCHFWLMIKYILYVS
ncbi:hemolysin III family protein [Patescibacteria group bacterium]|nr:hemolysin III family protein [Patescibacteria group bacterium]